jgi:hypothetical protein
MVDGRGLAGAGVGGLSDGGRGEAVDWTTDIDDRKRPEIKDGVRKRNGGHNLGKGAVNGGSGFHRVFMKTANPRKHGHKKAQKIVRPAGGNPPGAYRRRESCDRPPIFCAFL